MSIKTNILISAPLLAAVIITVPACKRISGYSTREVEIRQFVDLSRFKDIIKGGWVFSGSSISLDEKGNIYLLDIKGHRVLILNKKGQEIGQIGQIGQEKESLFNPWGISIDNGKISVLNNNAGEEVKIFTLDNRFVFSFKLSDSWMSEPIAFKDGRFFIGEKTSNAKNYNQKKLITVRDSKGDIIKSIGRIIPCASHIGYVDFNTIYFQVTNENIYGAHRHFPIIFCYDLDGRELLYKNISSLVPEIKQLNERVKEEDLDTPETQKREDDTSSRGLIYCYGFGIDRRQNIYYALQLAELKSNAKHKKFIIRMDKSANMTEKIIYEKDGSPLEVGPIVSDQKNKLYAVGFINELALFFPL